MRNMDLFDGARNRSNEWRNNQTRAIGAACGPRDYAWLAVSDVRGDSNCLTAETVMGRKNTAQNAVQTQQILRTRNGHK